MNNSFCKKCKLFQHAPVFDNLSTHPNAKVLVIGPFPTQKDLDAGKIFSDKPSQFFISQLQKLDVPFYLTNLVKCAPIRIEVKENKRTKEITTMRKISPPTLAQKNSCMVHCYKLIDELKPKVILTIGSFVTNSFLHLGLSIDMMTGITYYHPEFNAYIVPIYDLDLFFRDSVYITHLHKDLVKVKQLLSLRGTRKIISKPRSLKDPIEIKNYIEELKQQKLVSFDLETTGVDPFTDRITDISFAYKLGEGVHIKWSDILPYFEDLKELFSNKDIKFVGQNSKFDVSFLKSSGIEVHGNSVFKNIFDTMLAEHTLTMSKEGSGVKRYNLDRLSWVYTDEGSYKSVLSKWGGIKGYQDSLEQPEEDKLTKQTKGLDIPKEKPKKIVKEKPVIKPVARLPIYKNVDMFKRDIDNEDLDVEEDIEEEGINYACGPEHENQIGNSLIEELMNRGRKPSTRSSTNSPRTQSTKQQDDISIDEEEEASLVKYKDFIIEKRLKELEALNLTPLEYYAAMDADITLRVANKLMPKISETYSFVYDNLIIPLHFAISIMENTGTLIDIDHANKMIEKNIQSMAQPKKILFDAVGREFNISSGDEVRDVIYKDLKIPVNQKYMTKGGKSGIRKPSVDEEAINAFSKTHPILQNIIEYRRLEKENSTSFEGFLKLINPATGRIHGNFSQTAAATGRLSSTQPNLQNIPTADYIRNMIVPSPGNLLVGADLSQAELRILAMVSGDENMRSGFTSGFDFHVFTASSMFNIPLDKFDHKHNPKHAELRSASKTINFGIAYGRQAPSIAEQVGCSVDEAQGFMDKFFKSYPKAKQWINDTISFARNHGYVTTVHGRRRYIPFINSTDSRVRNHAENQAINTPIQGTASDCASFGLVNITEFILQNNYKARPIIIVHDEIQLDCPENEVEIFKEKLPYYMTNIPLITIPLVADVTVLTKWAK